MHRKRRQSHRERRLKRNGLTAARSPFGAIASGSALSLLLVGLVTVLAASAGCGTDFEDLAIQSGSSAAFTILDIILTDTANSILDQNRPAPDRDGDEGDGDAGDGDGDAGDGGDEVSPGEMAFVAQNCGACHGDSAEGGIGPALANLDELAALQERFGDGATHNGAALTEQEIADLAAWLLGENGGDDQASAGQAAFAAGDCGACHGESAEGGSALALAGMDELAALEARFGDEATHMGTSLTEQEIADIAAWLLGDSGDGQPSGDPAAGEAFFNSSICAACHCADASGGCGGDAPSLAGVDEAAVDDRLRGDADHPGGKFDVSDEEIVDLAAWLASL